MKRYLIYTFVLLALFAISCKRENCPFPGTKVEGIIIDDSTQKPIEGATIFLQRKKCEFGLTRSVCDYINVKEVESDGDGNFKLKFCKDKKRDYYIAAAKGGYYFNPGKILLWHIPLEDFINSDRVLKLERQ